MSIVRQDLVIIGASASSEILGLIDDINAVQLRYRVIGILDDDPQWHDQSIEGTPVLGLLSMVKTFPSVQFIFGIASFKNRLVRHKILQDLGIPKNRFETLVHPTAYVHSSAVLGHGVIVFPQSMISKGVQIGDFCQIVSSKIGFECHIYEGAIVSFDTRLTARVQVKPYAYIGMGSTIALPISVGVGVLVGAASLVLEDLSDGGVYMGNPLKLMRRDSLLPELEGAFYG